MTRNFASTIDGSRVEMETIVSAMASNNAAESSSLTEGIQQLLISGRSTCSELKDAIQGALSTLVGGSNPFHIYSSCTIRKFTHYSPDFYHLHTQMHRQYQMPLQQKIR